MTDAFDRASVYEATLLSAALANQKVKAAEQTVRATGYCLYCLEDLPDGRRWCDADCRDDWEYEQRRK